MALTSLRAFGDATHGIRPLPAAALRSDWSEIALQQTWRSLAGLCLVGSVLNAFLYPLPSVALLLFGAWSYGKGRPGFKRWLLRLVATIRRISR